MTRRRRTARTTLFARTVGRNSRSVAATAFLTLLFSVVVAILPQVVSTLLTNGVRYDVEQSTFLERDLSARIPESVTTGPATSGRTNLTGDVAQQWGGFDSAVNGIRDGLPSPLRSATGAPEYNVSTEEVPMVVPPGSTPKLVQLTTDPRIFDRITITAGRRPAPVTGDGTVVEVVLTAGNAERMRWKVGQVRSFTLQSGSEFEVRLSGTFRVDDPSNPYWRQTYNVNALTIPVASAGKVLATGFVDPRSLSQLTSFGFDLQTRIWYPTRLDALSLATAGGVAEQSRRFTSLGHTIDGAGTGQVAFSTQLASLLDAAATRTTTTLSVVAAIFAGPLGAALALVVLVTRLALLQARSALILLAGRGASRSRLRATVALVTALASIPSAAVGLLVGSLLTGVLPQGQGLLAAAITAAVPIVVAAVLLPSTSPRRTLRPLRPFVEAIVVLATLVAAGLTVRQIVVADAAPTRVDATAVALPLLLALTGCVVTARIVPVVLGASLPRLRKRPGVALFTGAAIVARGPGGTAVTLLAALIAVAVALFGSVLGTTLASGLEAAGRASVGSSIAVAADTLDDDVITGLGRLPGVASSVEIANEDDVTVANRGVQLPATVVIADTARLATVQRGVPGTFPIPGGLRKTTNGIPVVISQALADRLGGKSSQIAGTRLDVVAVEPSQTALTKSSEWILVDADQAEAIGESFGSANLALLRLEPGADPRAVAGAAERATGDASLVDTAQEAIDRLSENPLVPGMRALSLVASALAGAVGILALLLATLQETPARRARIALLSMLGLDRRQARRILAVESLPIGLAALVGGAAVAVAIVALVLPAIDLRSFTGSAERPPLAVDPLVVVSILVGGLVAVAAVTLVTIRTTSIRGVDRRLAPEE